MIIKPDIMLTYQRDHNSVPRVKDNLLLVDCHSMIV